MNGSERESSDGWDHVEAAGSSASRRVSHTSEQDCIVHSVNDDQAAQAESADRHKKGLSTPVQDSDARESEADLAWGWQSTFSGLSSAVRQEVAEVSESIRHALEAPARSSPSAGADTSATATRVAAADSPDQDLLHGLQAIDKQVDQLATAAGAALGSLWTGLGGAISTGLQAASAAAGHLEGAAAHAAKLAVEQAAARADSPAPPFADAVARTVGGTLVLNGDGSAGEGWQMVDLLGSPAASVTVSFEQLFKLFRGPRFTDDLEALASAAGKACTLARRDLPASGRKELGAAISAAAAAVDLIASIAPATDPRTAAAALCGGSPAAPPRSDPSGPRAAVESLAAAAVARAAAMHDTVAFDSHQHLWEGLCRVRAEGLKLLAEYSALCMQHLAFLAMCLEGGDTTAAGLHCSDDVRGRSAAVRAVLLSLLQHADAIYEAFHAALVAATESEGFAQLQHAPEGAAVDIGGTRVATRHLATVAAELKEGLHVGVCSAMERILQSLAADSRDSYSSTPRAASATAEDVAQSSAPTAAEPATTVPHSEQAEGGTPPAQVPDTGQPASGSVETDIGPAAEVTAGSMTASPLAGAAVADPLPSSSEGEPIENAEAPEPETAGAAPPPEAPSTTDLLGLEDPWDGSDSTPREPTTIEDAADVDAAGFGSIPAETTPAPGAVKQLIQELDSCAAPGGGKDTTEAEVGAAATAERKSEDAALDDVVAKLSPIKAKVAAGGGAAGGAASTAVASGATSSAEGSTAASTPSSARAKQGKGKRKGKKSR